MVSRALIVLALAFVVVFGVLRLAAPDMQAPIWCAIAVASFVFMLYCAVITSNRRHDGSAHPFMTWACIVAALTGADLCVRSYLASSRPLEATFMVDGGIEYTLRQKPWQSQRNYLLETVRFARTEDEINGQQ